VRLFNDIYVLRIVIVFNLISLIAAFGMGCSASPVASGQHVGEVVSETSPAK